MMTVITLFSILFLVIYLGFPIIPVYRNSSFRTFQYDFNYGIFIMPLFLKFCMQTFKTALYYNLNSWTKINKTYFFWWLFTNVYWYKVWTGFVTKAIWNLVCTNRNTWHLPYTKVTATKVTFWNNYLDICMIHFKCN